MDVTVTKFARHAGRWFAVEGTYLLKQLDGEYHHKFVTSDIHLNESGQAALFQKPKDTPGVIVSNQTNKKTYINGGVGARKKSSCCFMSDRMSQRKLGPSWLRKTLMLGLCG